MGSDHYDLIVISSGPGGASHPPVSHEPKIAEDGFPCLLNGNADAQVVCIDPMLARHPNVTLLTTVFQKTLAFSDYNFRGADWSYPLGLVQMCAGSHSDQIRGEALPQWLEWLPTPTNSGALSRAGLRPFLTHPLASSHPYTSSTEHP